MSYRDTAALQFALRLCEQDRYATNQALNKTRADYIAEDSVELADALVKRLIATAPKPEVVNNGPAPSNVIPIQFSKA